MHEPTLLPPDASAEVDVPETTGSTPTELPDDDLELEELLIREITIDGMCGVY
ncbi:MAG TPA: mycofactocin precursor MftA [Candidatus Dormibacteraeota bacterium]|nr:mycofactocin precursor MftA [Candidatus Dormibacteraeota bacterium]